MARGADYRIEYLDWLRAFAAGIVILGHASTPMAPGGGIGVCIFFALSGFLIADILLRDGMMTVDNILKFMFRRLARIYPMYALQLGAMVVFCYVAKPDLLRPLLEGMPNLLTFYGINVWIGYGVGVLWTLAIEIRFYLTVPFLLWLGLSAGRPILAILLGIAASVLAKVGGYGGATLHFYDQFLVGSLAAALMRYDMAPKFLCARWVRVLSITVLLVLGSIPFPGDRNALWFTQGFLAAGATSVLILSGHVQPPTFSLRWLAFFGRISYSAYLIHAVTLDWILFKTNNVPMNMPAYLLAVVMISTMTYYFIELPTTRWANQRARFSLPKSVGSLRHSSEFQATAGKRSASRV